MITLRAPTPADAPRLVEMVQESLEDLHPWMGWAVEGYGREEALKWIAETVENRAAGVSHEFFIADPVGQLLGTCGVNRIDPVNRLANFGYWVRSSVAGRGFAPAASHLMIDWAFANTELCRLEIVIAVGNLRSHRVAEKINAKREGVLRSRLWLHGAPHDATVFSIVRSEVTPA